MLSMRYWLCLASREVTHAAATAGILITDRIHPRASMALLREAPAGWLAAIEQRRVIVLRHCA